MARLISCWNPDCPAGVTTTDTDRGGVTCPACGTDRVGIQWLAPGPAQPAEPPC